MSLAREGPNPLRPYYIPPSVGYAQENGSLPSSSAASDGYSKSIPSASSRTSFSSSARGILSELDYSDYLSGSSSPSVKEVSKKLLDQALWKYTSVLVAQPFEVARTVLQCYAIPSTDSSRGSDASRKAQQRHGIEMYEDVRLFFHDTITITLITFSYPPMNLTLKSLPTSPPTQLQFQTRLLYRGIVVT